VEASYFYHARSSVVTWVASAEVYSELAMLTEEALGTDALDLSPGSTEGARTAVEAGVSSALTLPNFTMVADVTRMTLTLVHVDSRYAGGSIHARVGQAVVDRELA